MKKLYLNPIVDIVTMDVTMEIAASVPVPSGFDAELNNNGLDGSNALSRHQNIWDDEEYEEGD